MPAHRWRTARGDTRPRHARQCARSCAMETPECQPVRFGRGRVERLPARGGDKLPGAVDPTAPRQRWARNCRGRSRSRPRVRFAGTLLLQGVGRSGPNAPIDAVQVALRKRRKNDVGDARPARTSSMSRGETRASMTRFSSSGTMSSTSCRSRGGRRRRRVLNRSIEAPIPLPSSRRDQRRSRQTRRALCSDFVASHASMRAGLRAPTVAGRLSSLQLCTRDVDDAAAW